jgi:hypothetical protein
VAIVVVGGHSRSVGKTSVVAGLIAALPAYNWTAFKITQFGHGRCSLNGKPCDCAPNDRCWAITEERDQSGKSDSARFLAAGAKRSFWVRTEQGRLDEALPAIQRRITEAENAILESNSILQFIRPDIYISVLDLGTKDFKNSARRFLERADAIVLHGNGFGPASCSPHTQETPLWKDVSLDQVSQHAVFRIVPPAYVNSEFVQFVNERLTKHLSVCRP